MLAGMANVEYRYVPTEEDYVLALAESSRRAPMWLMPALSALLGYGLICVGAAILALAMDGPGRLAVVLGALGLLLLNSLILFRSNLTAAQLRESVRKAPYLRLPVSGVVSEGGISWSNQAAQSQLAWGAYADCVEYEECFALIPIGSFTRPVVLPKRAFTAEGVAQFKQIVAGALRRPPTQARRAAWPPLSLKLPKIFFTALILCGAFLCVLSALISAFSKGARP